MSRPNGSYLIAQYYTPNTFGLDSEEDQRHLYFSIMEDQTDAGVQTRYFWWWGATPNLVNFAEGADILYPAERKPLFYGSWSPPHYAAISSDHSQIYYKLDFNQNALDLFKFFYNPQEFCMFSDSMIKCG